MPTKNPRLYITLEQVTRSLLVSLAKQEQKSVASLAKELIIEALELREDLALSELAKIRDSGKQKTIKHVH